MFLLDVVQLHFIHLSLFLYASRLVAILFNSILVCSVLLTLTIVLILVF